MIGDARDDYYRSIGSKVSLLFGITMLVYSVMVIHQRFRTHIYDPMLFMTFLTLIISIGILLNKKRSILGTMGLYCLGMGLTRLPSAIMYLVNPEPTYVIALGVFFLIISVNMLYSAWQYLHGICRGYISSMIIIGFLWFLYTGGLIISLTGNMPDVTGTIFERVLDQEILAANVILFTAYMFVLGTDEIHDGCELEIAAQRFDSMRSICDAGHDASVSREDAKKIFNGPNEWNRVDLGPIESEHRFIVSYTDRALFGTIQKWKDDDELYVTISQNVWGKTMIEATRFSADEITCDNNGIDDCTCLYFRKRNGDCYCIEVLDDNLEVIL